MRLPDRRGDINTMRRCHAPRSWNAGINSTCLGFPPQPSRAHAASWIWRLTASPFRLAHRGLKSSSVLYRRGRKNCALVFVSASLDGAAAGACSGSAW